MRRESQGRPFGIKGSKVVAGGQLLAAASFSSASEVRRRSDAGHVGRDLRDRFAVERPQADQLRSGLDELDLRLLYTPWLGRSSPDPKRELSGTERSCFEEHSVIHAFAGP
jgi:hypothetical protein